jgi:hypothetical protein
MLISQPKQEIAMLRIGLVFLAAVFGVASSVAPAAAQGRQQQPIPVHANGFTPNHPDPLNTHILTTNPQGKKIVVTIPNPAGPPTGYVQGASGQYFPTWTPTSQEVTYRGKTAEYPEGGERHTYSGAKGSKFHVYVSPQ